MITERLEEEPCIPCTAIIEALDEMMVTPELKPWVGTIWNAREWILAPYRRELEAHRARCEKDKRKAQQAKETKALRRAELEREARFAETMKEWGLEDWHDPEPFAMQGKMKETPTTAPLPVFNEARARQNIPDVMLGAKRWFVYSLTWSQENPGKLDKKPESIIRRYGVPYSWDEPDGWVSFNEVCDAIRESNEIQDEILQKRGRDRYRLWPGFPITRDYKMIFIDLDKCLQNDGTVTQTARRYLDALKDHSFVEVSVSGTGLHLFTWYTGKRNFAKNPEPGVEAYIDNRGALITGDAYHG